MADFEYTAELDDRQIEQAVKQVNKRFRDLGNRGNVSFQQVGTSATKMGIAVGATAGIVTKLVEGFVKLGEAAARAISNVVTESTRLAIELDTIEKSFIGIFQGNEDIALAALDRIRAKSRELGVDLTELGQSFLPFVESLDQFERLGSIAAALARAQPEQGQVGARIALQEILAGGGAQALRPLVERFEIPKPLARSILELQDELGNTEGLIVGLEKILEELGRDAGVFADTFVASLARTQLSVEQLGAELGEPILDELSNQFSVFNQFLKDNNETLTLAAQAFGDVIASIVRLVGVRVNEFLQDFDPESLIEFANELNNIVLIGDTLISFILDWANTIDDLWEALSPGVAILEALGTEIGDVGDVLLFTLDAIAKSTAGWKGLLAALQPLSNTIDALATSFVALAQGDFITAADESARAFAIIEQGLFDLEAGQKATNEAYAQSTRELGKLREAMDGVTRSTNERRLALRRGQEEEERLANQFLANQRTLDLQEEALEAQAKIDEETEDAQLKHQRNLEDIAERGVQARIDAERRFSEQREDILERNAQRIEDIERGNLQDISDARRDLTRDEEDLATKQSRDRIELARDETRRLIEIERDFRRQLAAIERAFLSDAEEAERSRDAIAFVAAIRRRDREIEEARIGRDENVIDAREQAEQRREELANQQELERQELQLANQRKLEDIKIALQRELEEQRAQLEQQLEQQALNEARKREELRLSEERQIENASQANQRKLADLESSLAQEIARVQAAEEAKTEIVRREVERRQELEQRARVRQTLRRPRFGTQLAFGVQGFQDGGIVPGPIGSPQLAQVHGGEIIINPQRTPLALPSSIANNASQVFNSLRADVSMTDLSQMSNLQRAIAREELLAVLNRLRL